MSGQENGQFSIGNALTNMAQMNQMGIQNAQTRQAMYKTNLDIQQTLAQRAAGQDFQKAIDPATGQLSTTKYNQLLAADPNAAFAAQASSQAGQTNVGTQYSNTATNMANGVKHLQWAGNLASAYSMNPPTAKQLQADQIDGINAGLQTPSDAATVLSQAPTNLPPAQQKAAWANHALRFNAAAGQIAQSLPQPQAFSSPGGAVIGDTNPISPTFTRPGSVVTPGAAPTTTIVNPNNPTQTTYLGNAPPAIIPPGGAQPQAARALPNVNLGSGTYPNGQGTPPQPAVPAPNTVNPLQGQLSTAPIGTATLTNALAQTSANLVTSASTVQPLLSSAQGILTNLKSVSTGFNGGAASPDLMKLASGAATLGISVDPTGLQDYQVFNKLVAQLANSAATGGAVDPATDARLEAIENANPSSMMSPGARSDAIATVQGALAAKSAYYNGALQYAQSQPGIPPASLATNYARQWSKQFPDTIAFQFPYMSRPQQQEVYGGMSKAERASLYTTANNAINAGYFTKDAFLNGGQ